MTLYKLHTLNHSRAHLYLLGVPQLDPFHEAQSAFLVPGHLVHLVERRTHHILSFDGLISVLINIDVTTDEPEVLIEPDENCQN